jgi:hypothetical protein
LEETKETYKLKHTQAVLFINLARDRFRLVACFYNFAVLMLPPVDSQDRISLYLKVSQFLKNFADSPKPSRVLDQQIESATARVEQRKRLAAAAALARKGGVA